MIVEELAARLVEFQVEKPFKMLAFLGLLTVVILPGAINLDIKPSTEAILPADDPVVESLDTLRAKFAGDTTHVVFNAETDIRRHELMEKMLRVQNRIEKSENIIETFSPASLLEERHDRIPSDPETLEKTKYRGMVSDTYKTALISVRADTQAKSSEIRALYDDIKRAVESEDLAVDYHLTGYNMIDLATFQVIISDFVRITGVAFMAVLLVLYGVFRDLKRMFFPMVPVVFALAWMLGLGGYLGANLTIISMVSAAMIMGLGIDFGIHVTKKYYSTKRGKDGLSQTMTELSRGLLGGSTTTGVGFLALLSANLSGMHSLGIFLFTGIISAYIGAVFLLPVLIYLADSESII